MFDCRTPVANKRRLQEGGTAAIIGDHAEEGLYATIWKTLWEEGLRDYHVQDGKAAAQAYGDKLRSQAKRKEARAQKKQKRAQKKKRAR
jgi:hypothetical protein